MAQTPKDLGQDLMGDLTALLKKRFLRALAEEFKEDGVTPNPFYLAMSASEMEVARKLLTDNSVTLASVERGDFGEVARGLVQEFPFAGDPQETGRTFQ